MLVSAVTASKSQPACLLMVTYLGYIFLLSNGGFDTHNSFPLN